MAKVALATPCPPGDLQRPIKPLDGRLVAALLEMTTLYGEPVPRFTVEAKEEIERRYPGAYRRQGDFESLDWTDARGCRYGAHIWVKDGNVVIQTRHHDTFNGVLTGIAQSLALSASSAPAAGGRRKRKTRKTRRTRRSRR